MTNVSSLVSINFHSVAINVSYDQCCSGDLLKEMLENEIESLLKLVIVREGILNAKIKVLGGNAKGDGYLGVVTAAEVLGSNKSLRLVLKTAPKSDQLRKQMPIREIFDREINFYTKVYPAFRRFQIERGDMRPFICVATCFATISREMEEALVFQNLREVGFDVCSRRETMNREHVTFVLEEYGRLHALSYAVKDHDGELFRELTIGMDDVFQRFLDNPDFEKLLTGIVTKVGNLPNLNKNSKVKSALDNLQNSYLQFFKSINANADQYAVITHGDCWCNNMMFKYDDHENPDVPTSMRLIDWQLQRLGSPVLDLSYYLYACASKEMFNDLDGCLKIYYRSLSAQLIKLGSHPEMVLPFHVLKDQWRKFGKYGLILALLVIKIMLSESEEAPDLLEAAEKGESVMSTLNYESKNEEEYNRRVTDVVLHCCENQII